MSEDFDVDTVFVKFYENKKFLLASHFQRDTPVQAFFEFIGNYECVLETSSLSLGYNLKKNIRQVFPTESVVNLNIDEFYHDEVSVTLDKINHGSNYSSDSSLPDPKLNGTSGLEAIDLTQSSPEKSEGRLKNQKGDAGSQLIIHEAICISTSSNDEAHGQFTDEVELPKLKKHLKRKRIRHHNFLRDIESSESEEETPKAFVIENGKRKLPHTIFNNVALERVKFVPEDINGTKKYQVPIDSNDKFKYMRDERNWGRFKPSKRAGFFGIRYIQDCKGYFECRNNSCPFLVEYAHTNKIHFRPFNSGKDMQCEQCGEMATKVDCNARKITEIDRSEKCGIIYHFGFHGCPLKKASIRKISKGDIEDIFKQDNTKKPCIAGSGLVKQAILTDSTWENIETLAEGSLDSEFYKNCKKKVLTQMFPHGHNLDAVKHLKEKTDEKDKFLIYKVTDDIVFKTSDLKLCFLQQMNRFGTHQLSHSYFHVDAKADRCKQFTTITGSTFHPLLKQLVPLAIMECPSENKQFLSVFFSNLKEAVKEKFEDEEFDPTGIICDEASCNWQAMQEIFGRDLVERSKSCDFHYKQSINRTKGKITTGDDDKEIFKTLATDLMEAITSPQYEKTKDALQMFISTNENLTFLNNWLTWWNKRRAHWCYAFRPDHFAPGANLAEVTNARFFHRGSVNLSLIAAALDDVVDSLIFEKRYKKIGENVKVTGSGRTFFNIRETELKRQEIVAQKARRNITEIFDGPSTSIQSDRQASRSEFLINEDCSFEPTVKKQKMSNENQRPFPFRPRRNAQVNKSILFAKSANLKLLDFKKTENDITFSFQNYKEERIEVSLQQVPNCSCPFKTKNPSKICMHIVFALLRYFDVDENSMLLHQLAYTKSEFNKLKNSLVEIRTNNESLEQSWILSRKEKLPGKIPNCSGCKAKPIMPGDLHIYVKGKIILKNNIQKDATFRFCPDSKCLKNIPTWSNLKPFTRAFVDLKGKISENDISKISSEGIKIQIKFV